MSLTAWELLRGVSRETHGLMSDCSCISYGCGVCVCVCQAFTEGVARFLKSMENTVTGLD